jgi:hypothetical protein
MPPDAPDRGPRGNIDRTSEHLDKLLKEMQRLREESERLRLESEERARVLKEKQNSDGGAD